MRSRSGGGTSGGGAGGDVGFIHPELPTISTGGLQLPDDAIWDMPPATARTLAVRFTPSSNAGQGSVITYNDATPTNRWLLATLGGATRTVRFLSQTGGGGFPIIVESATSSIQDGTEYLCVITRSTGNDWEMFLAAFGSPLVSVDTANDAIDLTYSSATFGIGDNAAGLDTFAGDINEIALWHSTESVLGLTAFPDATASVFYVRA